MFGELGKNPSPRWDFQLEKCYKRLQTRANIFICLLDHAYEAPYFQNGMLKVSRKAFNIGEVWDPVCCHCTKTFQFVLWSTSRRNLTAKNQTFLIKIGWDIFFFLIFDQSLVGCMTSSIGQFKILSISGTKRDLKIVNWILFFFSYRLLVYVFKCLRLERCDFRHGTYHFNDMIYFLSSKIGRSY